MKDHHDPTTQWEIALPESMIEEIVQWFHTVVGHPGADRLSTIPCHLFMAETSFTMEGKSDITTWIFIYPIYIQIECNMDIYNSTSVYFHSRSITEH